MAALALERRVHRRDENHSKLERTERMNRVLVLIDQEPAFNLSALKQIDENILSTYTPIRSETWDAFSDGGEITVIYYPETLSSISTAYARIKNFDQLFGKLFNVEFFPSNNTYNFEIKRVLVNHTLKAKHDAVLAIEFAAIAISKIIPATKGNFQNSLSAPV